MSLSIFGAVGGPLFGMFTLGMFTLKGNQRGAITGLLVSLVFVLWIGFGQPKPPIETLSFSTEACSATSAPPISTTSIFIKGNATEIEYFWLYKISYMWYAPLGFFTVLIVGWIVSVVLDSFGLGGEPKIFSDENKTIINADLFTPPLAKRIRERNAEIMGKNFAIANGDFGDIRDNITHF